MNKQPVKITSSSVFVVSGGAKGITAECVIRLAQRYRCKFILLGRSAATVRESSWVAHPAIERQDEAELKKQVVAHLVAQGEKPTPNRVQKIVQGILAEHEITRALQAIKQAGGQAEYLSVDVTDGTALGAALPAAIQRLGPVQGIIHGAGSLADKLIERKTIEDFERVYDVKIKGLENLLACVPMNELDYLILFSSVAGFYGNIGQADYAIANEILNKTAHLLKRAYPACHIVAINWGPWDGGMVTPALKQYFADHQIEVIPVEVGAQMLIRELEHPHPTPQVVIGSPIQMVRRKPDSAMRSYRMRRKLIEEANPFLYDHIVGEHAVLPAVFGVSWITNTCEQLYPGYTFHCCQDYKVLKGIVFDESLAESYTLDIKEVNRGDPDEIGFEALIWSETPEKRQRFHYSGKITLRRHLPDALVYSPCDLTDSLGMSGEQLYQDGTLFHGPCFQGVEHVLNMSANSLTMRCRWPMLTEEHQGQFPLHTFNPYLADIQFQCMLIWLRNFYQASGMPLWADTIEHFRSIPRAERFYVSMNVQSSSQSKLIAQVMIHDQDGRIYMRVNGAGVTVSTRLNSLFAQGHARMAEQRR